MISECARSWLPAHSCLKDMLPDLVSNCTRPDSNLFFFENLYFVFYAEPKRLEWKISGGAVCALHMSITGVYLQKLSVFVDD